MKGFRILGRWVNWSRDISIDRSGLLVIDEIDSKDNDIVEIRYIMNQNIKCVNKKNNWIIKSDNFEFNYENFAKTIDNEIIYGEMNLIDGYSSKCYGEENMCKIFVNSFNVNGPIQIKSRFSLKN